MAKRVLIVDDDPDIRLFSSTVLEENGYTPIEATNGEEGMKIIKKEMPDLLILDMLMPRQSGIRLYRQMKTDNSLKHIPVIVLSGIAEKSFQRSQKDLTEFGDAPVPEPEAYLEKPPEVEALLHLVRRLVKTEDFSGAKKG